MKLTAREVATSKPKDKAYRLGDGGGLYLHVRKTGAKAWESRYVSPLTKKPTYTGLGGYPDISLAEARLKAQDIRIMVSKGIDPKVHKEKQQRKLDDEVKHTFYYVASLWLESKKGRIKERTIEGNWRKLEMYAFPTLKNTPISKVTAPLAISALRPVEEAGYLETVKRTAQVMNEVMTYAVNSGLIHANPLAGIRDVFKKHKVKHMTALEPHELPELVQSLSRATQVNMTTKLLIEWQLHTMTRPSEAAGAQWSEIDLERGLWVIPPERMKMKREHVIPLTDQTMKILDEVRPITGHSMYVFASSVKGGQKPTDAESINKALQRIGFKGRTTAHGLRALASTTLNEQSFNPDVIEAALAHVDKNTIRKAYNRSTYMEQRKKLMTWWSKHIEQAARGEKLEATVRGLKVVGE